MERTAEGRKKRQGRAPQAVDREFLDAAALGYLNRFDATEVQLTQVLLRRAKLALARLPPAERTDEETVRCWIKELIDRYVSSGLISDRRVAEGLCRSMRARGASHRAIVEKLKAKGVKAEAAAAALAEADESADEPELAAARALVRRRRLGPFREPSSRAANGQKDLARLARAGFSFEVARRALMEEPS